MTLEEFETLFMQRDLSSHLVMDMIGFKTGVVGRFNHICLSSVVTSDNKWYIMVVNRKNNVLSLIDLDKLTINDPFTTMVETDEYFDNALCSKIVNSVRDIDHVHLDEIYTSINMSNFLKSIDDLYGNTRYNSTLDPFNNKPRFNNLKDNFDLIYILTLITTSDIMYDKCVKSIYIDTQTLSIDFLTAVNNTNNKLFSENNLITYKSYIGYNYIEIFDIKNKLDRLIITL